jgi:hypothetical protein
MILRPVLGVLSTAMAVERFASFEVMPYAWLLLPLPLPLPLHRSSPVPSPGPAGPRIPTSALRAGRSAQGRQKQN